MSMPVETIMEQSSVASGRWPADDERTLSDAGFYWRECGAVKVLICKPLEEAGFANGFSTRVGGVSDFPKESLNLAGFDEDASENIYENRRRFLAAFDDGFKLATAWQVHGDGVKIVRNDTDIENSEEHFDALASDLGGVLAGVKTADCVPILIGDPIRKAFAAVHSGWKGTAKSIVTRAVETLRSEYGALPESMIAAIGPAACGRDYEVGPEVIEQLLTNIADGQKYFVWTRPGHAYVDLRAINRDKLVLAGVRAENIHFAPLCTMESADLFFSYRREKQTLGKTGRLLSVIGRR